MIELTVVISELSVALPAGSDALKIMIFLDLACWSIRSIRVHHYYM